MDVAVLPVFSGVVNIFNIARIMAKLLLVEDNEVNRDMLSRRLQRREYEVSFASNGAEGVSKALTEQPDLILMDINLPVMDGWEATRQIKANPQTKYIPIIALTADAMASDREKALAAGCDEYETKPVDLPRLLSKIETLLEKTKSHKQDSAGIGQNSRIQRSLLSHLRHELCTPMNAIIGYSEMLLEELKYQTDSELFKDLQKINACGTQLLTLANAILDPTQLELSHLDRNLDSFSSTIRLEMLTPLSTVIGYCEMLLEEAPAELIADLDRINAAAQHLLSMVNDIINIATQQLQVINTNELSVGSLILESQTATSVFQSAFTTIQSLSQATEQQLAQGGMILVVDDNETNCDLLKRQLERQGYTVATANNGQQALRMLKAVPYDLILLDIVMSGMNGFEVLEQLKSHEDWRHLPVIMISALDELDSVVRCVEMGAEDYLTKPFKPVLLRAKITASLEKKRLRDQQVLLLAQRLIAEATPVPVMISRLEDGTILYANATAAVTFGFPVEELLNRHVQDFYFDPAERQEVLEVLSRSESIHRREIRCVRADGKPFWVTASLQQLTFNGEATILSALCDITDRKQAEEALRLAEANYRSIFENALDGIYQSTPEGNFIRVNPAMARVHGYNSPAAMMQAVTQIGDQIYVDPNSREEFRHKVEAQGEVSGFEYQAYRQDGEIIWVAESARLVQDANGQLLYYEGIVQDVTERKLAEAALKREVEELRIEIDQAKRARQVAEITQTDYFQQLQAEVNTLRFQDQEQQRATPKILLVEDNEMNRDMLSRRLYRSGYEVAIAVDGEEAVLKATLEKPDLILMDMSLPVMDGWEATQQIKGNTQTKSIPVIALTAHAMAGDREKALAVGCDEYDTKPIELQRLLGKIETVLQKAKSYF